MKIVYIYITSWIVSTTGKVCNIYIYTNFPYFSPDKSLSSHGFVVTAPFTTEVFPCSLQYSMPGTYWKVTIWTITPPPFSPPPPPPSPVNIQLHFVQKPDVMEKNR